MRGAGIAIGTSLLALAGCRPSLDLCADGCASAGDTSNGSELGGAGGRQAAGGSPSGTAGDGGDPAVCETNDDCTDQLTCNGDELCEDNVCVPGTPLACDAGTSCSEDDPKEPCAYATPSPWLILLGNETIWGLPTAEIGKRKMLELGWRKSAGLLVGMNAIAFSAGGQHAFVEYLAEDFGKTFLELSFGRGVPETARPVANLPIWGTYSEPVLSRDGERGLLADYDLGGAYSLDLSGARAAVAQLDATIDWGNEVAFCSDDRTWLRTGPQTTLFAEAPGQPMAIDLEHEDDYDVEVSPDGRVIWLGGESQRLVACTLAAPSEPLGVAADSAEFSPDSRFLLLTLEDGSTKLLSVTESLTTTEIWSGGGVLDWHWSEGAGSLLLHLGTEDASSYGYLPLSEEQPALVTLALDGSASILSCGREACLARGPAQDDTAGPLLLQALEPTAAPVVLNDSATAEVVLADFERNRLLLQRATAQGNELTLSDFAGAPERRLFDWPSGKVTVERATDDSGFYILLKDNVEFSNYWVTIPHEATDKVTLLPLDVLAYRGTFQPWP